MNSRARGFTLVELLVVSVMLTLVMGAVYQTLISQQRSSRHLSAVVSSEQTNRTAATFLASELREIGTKLAGDITTAGPQQITFRAMRKVGFVCAISGSMVSIYTLGSGGNFAVGDNIVIYADKGTQGMQDDSVKRTSVTAIGGWTSSNCPAGTSAMWNQTGFDHQSITVANSAALSNVSIGAEIRSYADVTYGTFTKGSNDVFGRQLAGDTAVTLIGPLVSGANGFTLQYFDTAGVALPAPVTAASMGRIARIRITVRGLGKGAVTSTGTYSAPLFTDVTLRGN